QIAPLIEIGDLVAIETRVPGNDVRPCNDESGQNEEQVDALIAGAKDRTKPETEVERQPEPRSEPAEREPEMVGEYPERGDAAQYDDPFEPGALLHQRCTRFKSLQRLRRVSTLALAQHREVVRCGDPGDRVDNVEILAPDATHVVVGVRDVHVIVRLVD